jgi:arylsulfate sulfotransferase
MRHKAPRVSGLPRSLSLAGLAFLWTSAALRAQISVTLSLSPAGPQPVGSIVTWTAKVQDAAAGAHEYRFRVGPQGGSTHVVRDFTSYSTFQWAAGEGSTVGPTGVSFTMVEGTYEVSVVAQNISNKTVSAPATQSFVVTSRLRNHLDSVASTANPLVALFSAQTCVPGNFIRVRFNQAGSSVSQTTNAIPCSNTKSANFYIAGMYASSQYQMHHETLSASGAILHTGSTFTFTTGSIPPTITIPAMNVVRPAVPPSSASAPILLHGYILGPVPTATDLSGNILWYYDQPVGYLTRTETGGRMFVLNSHSTNLYNNTLAEIDLAGNITIETNAQRINEQLAQMTDPITGQPRRPINQFDHEARRLPNGNIVVKAVNELVVNASQYPVQCGTNTGTCDVIGAQLLVLNPNLQLIWAWDAFDFLDINRVAPLGETCTHTTAGCPVFFLAATANDWLHANSIQLTTDGSLLFSLRDQDWVIKINYANGAGDGSVLWRMGYQGDFTMNNPPTSPLCTTPDQQDAYQWFSHQHDTNFQPFDLNGQEVFTVFDNGNLRIARCDTNGNSRGYVLNVDETKMTVTPLLAQDLGNYSVGLGSAEVIPGTSDYHFELGNILNELVSKDIEITPLGLTAFELDSEEAETYRSFRMQDLYTPPQPL